MAPCTRPTYPPCMRKHRYSGVCRATAGFFLVVSAALASATGHQPRDTTPAAACAFRSAAMENLLDADSQVGIADAALTTDPTAARTALAAARRALEREARRARHDGKRALSMWEADRYRHVLRALLRRDAKTVEELSVQHPRGRRERRTAAEMTGVESSLRSAIANVETAIRAGNCVVASLTVGRLFVGDGEELRVPGGISITAQDGIELRGRLVVDPPSGDVTLVARTGDIVLGGNITYEGRVAVAAPQLPSPAARPLAQPQSGAAPAGGSIVITAMNGNVTVGATYFAIAGDGADASDVVLGAQTSPLPFHGEDGGPGGSIQLAAPVGTVRILPRATGDPPPFQPGSGGHGGSVTLASGTFETPWPTLAIYAGKGGDSGRLGLAGHLVANQTGGLPLIAGARGGDGGSVAWDNARATTSFSVLTHVGLAGGAGGDAEIHGGNGGGATYLSSRVLNPVGAAVTAVAVIGGTGGSVIGPGVGEGPVAGARGGDGGTAVVEGNRGWDADGQTARNGASGGSVSAAGGSGGHVSPPPGGLADDLPGARGGDGGAVEAMSGDGGNGAPGCSAGMPGGRGGDAGTLDVYGGNGGDGPTAVSPGVTTTGGNGGRRTVRLGAPGEGGEGDPPGACGAEAPDPMVFSADGGAGTHPGRLGALDETAPPACAGVPVACSSTTTTVTSVPPTSTTEQICSDRLSYTTFCKQVFDPVSHPRGDEVSDT